MTTKPTFEDYVKMGETVKKLNSILMETDILISGKIGKTKTKRLCDFGTFEKKFQNLRSELEEMMYRDYPDKATTDVFY
jgi:hypothetical protein